MNLIWKIAYIIYNTCNILNNNVHEISLVYFYINYLLFETIQTEFWYFIINNETII